METQILITTNPGDKDIPYRYRVSPRPRLSRSHLVSVCTEMRRMFAAEIEIPALARKVAGQEAERRARAALTRRLDREPRHYRAGGPKEHWHKVAVASH